MIAELISFFRRGSRPFGRAYWWPGRTKDKDDAAGVLLISLAHVQDKTRHKLLQRYPNYHRHELLDDARPSDRGLDKPDSRLAVTYRLLVVLARSLYFWRALLSRKLSLANHLCECDGLARTHQAVMLGLPFHHMGDLRGQRWRDIRHLERLVKNLEHRRYEVWLLFRDRREVYVPASLALPEVPLSVAEVEQLARHRCDPVPTVSGFRQLAPLEGQLRIMTYNVHSCIGLDGRLSVRRIAEVLERYSPHLVALQELDDSCPRTGSREQLEELSRLWPSEPFFFPAMKKGRGQYGIGILSRLPLLEARGHTLPRPQQGVKGEPRVAVEIKVQLTQERVLTLLNTHLGLSRAERMAQIQGLESVIDKTEGPLVVLGDFNCPPRSPEIRRLLQKLEATSVTAPKTWFGAFPVRVLDYIMVRGLDAVKKSFVPVDHLTKVASDHLPLIVDFELQDDSSPIGISVRST